eukprot:12936927-Prorocentrum_lima.AAC.1
MEAFILDFAGSEEVWQRWLKDEDNPRWDDLWEKMEMRLCRAAGLDGSTRLADAIREYGMVRLTSSDPQA